MPETAGGRAAGPVQRRIPAAERRKRIVKAARTVFAATGYEASSLDEIAAKAKITKPVLYDHFESKQDLYTKVLEDASEELLTSLLDTLGAPAADPRARVVSALDVLTEWIASHADYWRLLFREPAGPRAVVRAHREVRARASAAIARELLDEKAMKRDPERLAMTAEILAGGIHSLTEWWYRHRDVPPSKVRDAAVAVLWDGLGCGSR